MSAEMEKEELEEILTKVKALIQKFPHYKLFTIIYVSMHLSVAVTIAAYLTDMPIFNYLLITLFLITTTCLQRVKTSLDEFMKNLKELLPHQLVAKHCEFIVTKDPLRSSCVEGFWVMSAGVILSLCKLVWMNDYLYYPFLVSKLIILMYGTFRLGVMKIDFGVFLKTIEFELSETHAGNDCQHRCTYMQA